MEISGNLATKAYNNSKPAIEPVVREQDLDQTHGPDFATMAKDLIGSLQQAENRVHDGLTGKADAHSVVEALAATELAVETAVTIRDKVVEAYQEILRMPV